MAGRPKFNFSNWLIKKFHGKFTLENLYTGINSKVNIKHHSSKCNYYTFRITAKAFKRNPKCPVCNGNKENKYTIQRKIKRLGYNFKIIHYKDKNNITFKCKHNHIFTKSYYTFLKFPHCPKCIQNNRKTQFDEFIQKYGFTRVGKYKGRDHKTYVKHLKCGYTWHIDPVRLVYAVKRDIKSPCPYCNHNIPWTKDVFKRNMFKEVGNEYSIVSDFKGIHHKVILRHNECNNTFPVLPSNFLYGSKNRCPYCRGTNTKKYLRLMKKHQLINIYTLLSKVHNLQDNIKVQHIKCGTIFTIKACSFLAPVSNINNHCPSCRRTGLTTFEVQQRLNKKYNKNYLLLSTFIGINKEIKLKHRKCGYIFSTIAVYALDTHPKYSLCPNCYKKKLLLHYKKDFIEHLPKDFKLQKLINNHKRFKYMDIKLFHSGCDRSFWTTPFNFRNRTHKCPFCGASSGEKLIMEFLDIHNIKTWCYAYLLHNSKRKQKRLHLDFKINNITPTVNNKFYKNGIGIEFDGIQHFDPKAFHPNTYSLAKHLQKFHNLQRNDKRKNKYCKNHDIYLIRIPYNKPELKELNKKLLPLIK